MALVFPNSMPYDEVNIIDQSNYTDTTNVVDAPFIPTGPCLYAPFISPKGFGKDNTLQYISAAKLPKYGNPNLKKYGLSLYLARRFVEAGGTLLGMRVTTDEMHHANAVIVANLSSIETVEYEARVNNATGLTTYHPVFTSSNGGEKVVFEEIFMTNPNNPDTVSMYSSAEDGSEIVKTLLTEAQTGASITIKVNGTVTDMTYSVTLKDSTNPTTMTITNNGVTYTLKVNALMNKVTYSTEAITGDIAATLDGVINEAESLYADNNAKFPIAVVVANGAGAYGNAYKFRIVPDVATNSVISATNDNAFTYKFIDAEGQNALDSAFTFAFNDEYMYNNESMCIDEVFENYSQSITMRKLSGYDDLCDALKESENKPITNTDMLDILFGTNSNEYIVDTISTGTVDLSKNIGINLTGGTDPSATFSYSNDPFAEVLAKAYNGEIDDMIYDQVRYPYQFLFCPSVDERVTDAVHNLATVNRKGTRVSYFVTGSTSDVPSTYEDARIKRLELPDDTWKEDTFVEWARQTDPYTGRKTYFPSVYWNAYAFPRHWINLKGKPLAGPSHAVWTGFDVGTVTPRTGQPAQYIANHNARINTMIEDGVGRAVMYEQITSQKPITTNYPTPNTVKAPSALSEINNAQILVDMVRIALRVASNNRWSDLGDDEVGEYKKRVEEYISAELGSCYETMEVIAVRASANGAGANRVYCKINVKFKNILKGVSYDFYILAN